MCMHLHGGETTTYDIFSYAAGVSLYGVTYVSIDWHVHLVLLNLRPVLLVCPGLASSIMHINLLPS